MQNLVIILLALFLSQSACDLTIAAFEGPPFSVKPPSGMYQLAGLNFDNVVNGNQLVGYGDFNNDKFTDIITASDDLKTLTIFVYSHGNFGFSSFAQITVQNPINGVIPGDYNYDGLLDLLVISSAPNSNQLNLGYFFRQKDATAFGTEANAPNYVYTINNNIQPFVLDVNGDRRLNLMFMDNGVRKIQNIGSGTDDFIVVNNFTDYVSQSPDCIPYSKVANFQFTTPHSNSFADFNGDCAADLFITSTDSSSIYFETWLRNPSDGLFCLVDATSIPYSQISLVTLGDMDNNGRIDLIYAEIPSSNSAPMNLHIIYNQFAANYKEPCSAPTTAMISPFSKDAYGASFTIPGITQVSPITAQSAQNMRLQGIGSSSSSLQPPRIRVGDINIDGFQDLLFVVSSQNSKSGTILLGINEGGIVKFDNASLTTPDDHSYFNILLENKLMNAQSRLLSSYQVLSASFYDFDELGHLGIWAVTYENSKSNLVGLFNFVNSENFILKTLGEHDIRFIRNKFIGLNGAPPTDDIVQSLGGIYYGPSFECVITDIDGNPRLAKSIQLPQSAYNPLDLPYMFLGLGRTNNYVENFAMGIPKKASDDDLQTKEWTPIIPNSQLIVNPLINTEWTLDVYVNPTSETLFVVLVTVAILLVLGGIIIYLHKKEKEEDEKNRDRILNLFG